MLDSKTGSLEIMCDGCNSSLLDFRSSRELGLIMVYVLEELERQLISHLQLTGWDDFTLSLCYRDRDWHLLAKP